jgi:hypothetical protein
MASVLGLGIPGFPRGYPSNLGERSMRLGLGVPSAWVTPSLLTSPASHLWRGRCWLLINHICFLGESQGAARL